MALGIVSFGVSQSATARDVGAATGDAAARRPGEVGPFQPTLAVRKTAGVAERGRSPAEGRQGGDRTRGGSCYSLTKEWLTRSFGVTFVWSFPKLAQMSIAFWTTLYMSPGFSDVPKNRTFPAWL